MNLKEAFRYQNKIQSLMDEAMRILSRDDNVTDTKATYLRKKVNPEAEDETVLMEHSSEYGDQINDVIGFLLYLLDQKEKLFAAIRVAKSKLDIDMDGEISLNGTRQNISACLRHLNDLRNSEKVSTNSGTGYKFNVEGNQVSYRCDIKTVTTINFDRNMVRTKLKEINQKADKVSTKIDLCIVNSDVDFEPPFDVTASFADAFEGYKESART